MQKLHFVIIQNLYKRRRTFRISNNKLFSFVIDVEIYVGNIKLTKLIYLNAVLIISEMASFLYYVI